MSEAENKKVRKVKRKIESNLNTLSIGTITSINDFMIEATGINNAFLYEEVSIPNKASGFIAKINYNKVVILLCDIKKTVSIGDDVRALDREYKCAYSVESLGRICDIHGTNLISNKEMDNLVNIGINANITKLLDRRIRERKLETGIGGIDLLYPIKKGSSVLISGDEYSKKTNFALNIIANERNKDVVCFYLALNKSMKEVKSTYESLAKNEALTYTTLFLANANPAELIIAPIFVLNAAKELSKQNYDVLVVIDDMDEYEEAYRTIDSKINANNLTNNESILMDYANEEENASITILTISKNKNISSLVDAEIVLDSNLIKKGIYPGLDYNKSYTNIKIDDKENDILRDRVKESIKFYSDITDKYKNISIANYANNVSEEIKECKKIITSLNQKDFTHKSIEAIENEINK